MKRPTTSVVSSKPTKSEVGEQRTTPNGKHRIKRKRKRAVASRRYDNVSLLSSIVYLLAVTASVLIVRHVRSVRHLPEINIDGDKKVEKSKHKNGRIGGRKERPDDDSTLPEFKWPVSIRDEDNNFEDVIHPGDGKTIMSLPKYWSLPIPGEDGTAGSLLSRDVATRFGSYVDGVRDTDHKNKGDPNKRTIFVAVASYRDWQCRYTVESLLSTARFPNRVRIVVVDQIVDGDDSCGIPVKPCEEDPHQALCEYADHVDVIEIQAELAVGPVFARYLGHRLYRGEYYSMQVDAHVTLVTDWDVDIIKQIESTNNEMAVISTYLTDIEGSIDPKTGMSKRNTRPIMCNTDFEGDGASRHLRHNSQPEVRPSVYGSPQMQPYWAAGWSFARGHFVVNVPYDLHLPMVFMGEETSVGIRAFTFGYDHYAAERSICFHTYANGKNAEKRNKVNHFWEHGDMYKG